MSAEETNKLEGLKYTMLGEDHESTYEKLSKFKGIVDWKYLKPHFETGVLHFVDPELDLVEVGMAFSKDDLQAVSEWLGKGDVVKIGDLHAAQWEQGDQQFEALVVSPFVLFRPVT